MFILTLFVCVCRGHIHRLGSEVSVGYLSQWLVELFLKQGLVLDMELAIAAKLANKSLVPFSLSLPMTPESVLKMCATIPSCYVSTGMHTPVLSL